MKQTIYVIIRTVTNGGENRKDIVGAAPAEYGAKKRMSELVEWYENMKDEEGNTRWSCDRPLWGVAKFSSRSSNKFFRLHVEEREVEI